MTRLLRSRDAFAGLAVLMMTLLFAGCPAAEKPQPQPSKKPAPVAKETPPKNSPLPETGEGQKAKAPQGTTVTSTEEPAKSQDAATAKPEETPAADQAAKPRDLGPPLVDNVDKLRQLVPDSPVWLDAQNKQVVFLGEVCRADYPLEFFVTYPNKSYESIVVSEVRPSVVHAGLLALGAEPGHPVQFQPEFVPPAGTEVAIEVRWKDAQGKVQLSPAQDWVRNVVTKKALGTNWVFAGSGFVIDEATGKPRYMADWGDFICLLNLPSAMLDLPIRSEKDPELRQFEGFLEHLPPAGTSVTLLLKPKVEKKASQRQSPKEANTGFISIVTPRIIIQEEEEEKLGVVTP